VSPSIQKNPISTLLFRLWHHLSKRRQFQFWLLLGLMIASAFVEMISLGAVLPFLGILIVPDKVFSHPIVHGWAPNFGISSADELVLPLTVAFGAAALVAGAFRILLLWISTRMAFAMGADLSIEVYRRTLFQPYWVHVARNSSQIISSITNKVNGVVFEVLLPLLLLISSLVLSVAIMVALFVIDPMVASAAIIIFGFSYGLITWFTRKRLYKNSQSIAREQTQVVKALQEGLGGIRDVLLEGAQSVYCDVYRNADRPLRWAQGSNAFVGNYPRYALETLGMVLITILAYFLSLEAGGLAESVPVLGALAIGAQRVLPALQQSYGSWARIAGTHASLDDTLELLDQPLSEESFQSDPVPMDFEDSIQYRGVSFRYVYEGPLVLDSLNLNISKGARVGFVGRTGSGKSTALDLMMGLLLPTEGGIFVDDQPIGGQRVRAWQRTIAHVPQSIYLSDNTLAENIAFGVPLADIDTDKVRQAAQQAQISDFIESGAEGYKAIVGERGIRLSGGQRQRIGIARALYKQASVLVFDEATSALDNATEKEVMNSIDGLKRDLTILIIAHRITTVRHCDVIVELDQGRVVAQGTFEQLIQTSPSFREMAKAVGEKNFERDL
jgi:ATP-binding cassette, subfamily B, bacterial PglK